MCSLGSLVALAWRALDELVRFADVLLTLFALEAVFDTFDGHVRLTNGEGVNVVPVIQVREGVVDEAVRRLV